MREEGGRGPAEDGVVAVVVEVEVLARFTCECVCVCVRVCVCVCCQDWTRYRLTGLDVDTALE